MKKLKITIYPNGYVQTETQGIKGKACEKYYPFFQRILQDRVVEQMNTEEYYEEVVEGIEETEEIERTKIEL